MICDLCSNYHDEATATRVSKTIYVMCPECRVIYLRAVVMLTAEYRRLEHKEV